MSLNHLLYPLENDDERLNVKFRNVYCDNLLAGNIAQTFNNLRNRTYEQLSGDVLVVGGQGEATLFNLTDALGSNLIPADSTRKGTKYMITSHGNIETVGSNNAIILQVKLNTAIMETITITLPNLNSGTYFTFDGEILFYEIGNAGTAVAKSFFKLTITDIQGLSEVKFANGTNNTTVQTTADNLLDMTVEWSSNNSSNIFSTHNIEIARIY